MPDTWESIRYQKRYPFQYCNFVYFTHHNNKCSVQQGDMPTSIDIGISVVLQNVMVRSSCLVISAHSLDRRAVKTLLTTPPDMNAPSHFTQKYRNEVSFILKWNDIGMYCNVQTIPNDISLAVLKPTWYQNQYSMELWTKSYPTIWVWESKSHQWWSVWLKS